MSVNASEYKVHNVLEGKSKTLNKQQQKPSSIIPEFINNQLMAQSNKKKRKKVEVERGWGRSSEVIKIYKSAHNYVRSSEPGYRIQNTGKLKSRRRKTKYVHHH